MTFSPNLDQMTPEQLRALAAQALQLQSQVEAMSRKIQNDETIIEQLTYEIALLKRHKFAKRSEQISTAQGSLLDDLLDTDLEAIEAELKQLPIPQTCAIATAVSTHGDSSRTGKHSVRLWLPTSTHRRRR